MTAYELAELFNIKDRNRICAFLSPVKGVEAHICAWRRDEDGGHLYPRAVYAYGPGQDAKKIKKLSRAEYNKRAKDKLKKRVASVFELGVNKRVFYNKAKRIEARWTTSTNHHTTSNTQAE